MPLKKEADMSRELINAKKNCHMKQAMNCTRKKLMTHDF